MASSNTTKANAATKAPSTHPGSSDTIYMAVDFVGDQFICRGVRIRPVKTDQVDERVDYQFEACATVNTDDASPWRVSPIADALGFPLRVKVEQSADHDSSPQVLNPLLARLFIDPSHKSPNFSKSSYTTTPSGRIIIARKDGKDLHIAQVSAFCMYITKAGKMVEAFRESKGGTLSGWEKGNAAGQLLTRQAFHQCFEEIKQDVVVRGDNTGTAYRTATNPVDRLLLFPFGF